MSKFDFEKVMNEREKKIITKINDVFNEFELQNYIKHLLIVHAYSLVVIQLHIFENNMQEKKSCKKTWLAYSLNNV